MSPPLSWNLRERSSLIYRILHIIDCSLVSLTLYALVKLYQVPWNPYYNYLEILSFVLSFLSFHHYQLYRSWRGWKYYREFMVIVQGWGTVVGLLLFYFFIFKISHTYSRVVFIIWSLIMPLIIFISHLLVRKTLRYFRSQGKNIRHAVIAGAGPLGQRMAKQMEDIPWAGIEVLGFFDDKDETRKHLGEINKPLLGRIEEIKGYLSVNDIDYVYIALPMRAELKIFRILAECRDLGAHIYLVPDLYTFGLHNAEIQSLGDMLVLNFNPDLSWKRRFDIVFSLAVLILFSPFFLLIAMAIKLTSRGPVLYGHRRIMATGREFGCLKFRTMVVDADKQLAKLLENDDEACKEWGKTFKLKKDPRVTWIGKFLRRTSLDELPQFINVLKGDMSVVGARPIVSKELQEFYKEKDNHSAGRYCSMKPGITGPWQVTKRSDTDDYQERVQLDDWYVLNHSLRADLKIILKTIWCMFTGKGAY
ncbi:MAG: sugar transferase [Desulfobulbaceae bacterium]|nr:sugar transferase [Desulfobulbaceae bacterium]